MSREPLFTRRFAALWLFQFFTFFAAFQLFPAIPLRILELGGTTAAAGSFLAVYTFASAFSAPMTGTIADRIGRRRMLVIASVLFIAFSVAYGLVQWLPLLLLIGVVHGSIWSGILSSASALMTEFIPVSRRTEGLAYWGLAPTTAIAVAPAIGLLVYRWGWLTLCLELALLSCCTALWGMRLPGLDARSARELPRVHELWDWSVVKATLSLAVVNFGYGGITSYVVILSHQRGITPDSLFFTSFTLTIIVVRVFTSRLGDRFGPKVLLYPAFAAMPVSFALLARASDRTELVASAILFGLGIGASMPAFMTFIVTHTDEAQRGRTFGSMVWAIDTGIGVGSLITGAIGQRYGLGTAFAAAAALSCLAIPIFIAASRGVRGTAVAPAAEHAGT
ncbi:MAG: MFS transporter [Acidobacteria bacterium]|nr:MFS transporter [Acidobacteriota bacterium]MBV9479048.1 MFS transporter [Acidobacteriota bacterium]